MTGEPREETGLSVRFVRVPLESPRDNSGGGTEVDLTEGGAMLAGNALGLDNLPLSVSTS